MLLKMCMLDERINELLCQVRDEGAMALLSHLAGLIKTIATSHGKPGRCNSSRTIFFLLLVVLMCWVFCKSVRQSMAVAPDEVVCFISHGRKPAQALHLRRVSIFEKTITQMGGYSAPRARPWGDAIAQQTHAHPACGILGRKDGFMARKPRKKFRKFSRASRVAVLSAETAPKALLKTIVYVK